MMRTAHVYLWAAATCGGQAGAFIHGSHARNFDAGPSLPARSPSSARQPVGVIPIPSLTATCARRPQPRHQLQNQPREASRSSYARLRALPEDTDVESSTSRGPAAASSASEATETEGVPGNSRSSAEGGKKSCGGAGSSSGTSTGKDGQFISKLSRRLADSFPLLTADEIKNEVRMLLNPETKVE